MELLSGIVRVGDGRGFLIDCKYNRFTDLPLIVRAAHCLPEIPEPHVGRYLSESTIFDFVSDIGKEEKAIAVEILFCDVIADIAVLGETDNQELSEEHEAYEIFVENRYRFAVGEAPEDGTGQLLSIDGKTFKTCEIKHIGGPLHVTGDRQCLKRGVSGSPVIDANGRAVGVIVVGGRGQTNLTRHLPGWVLRGAKGQQEGKT